MAENWDRFPQNIAETAGKIEKKSFIFNYNRFEVWQARSCIYAGNSNGQIIAKLVNSELNVIIDDPKINNHIIKHFSFGEISTVNERIMWSKDIFNKTGISQRNNPDISSLFFKKGVLSKVTFTIHNPNTLVEFYGENSEIESVSTTHSQNNDLTSMLTFLNKFKSLPMHVKMDITGKTDELNNTGVNYYYQGDIENAINYYNKALEIFPLNDDSLQNLIKCYSQTKNYPKMQEAQRKLNYLRELGL